MLNELETTVLKELYKRSAVNSHLFGFTDNVYINQFSSHEVSNVITSLHRKKIFEYDNPKKYKNCFVFKDLRFIKNVLKVNDLLVQKLHIYFKTADDNKNEKMLVVDKTYAEMKDNWSSEDIKLILHKFIKSDSMLIDYKITTTRREILDGVIL